MEALFNYFLKTPRNELYHVSHLLYRYTKSETAVQNQQQDNFCLPVVSIKPKIQEKYFTNITLLNIIQTSA